MHLLASVRAAPSVLLARCGPRVTEVGHGRQKEAASVCQQQFLLHEETAGREKGGGKWQGQGQAGHS
eukprot:5376520-Lingulodinium_polyedra.AAC.1